MQEWSNEEMDSKMKGKKIYRDRGMEDKTAKKKEKRQINLGKDYKMKGKRDRKIQERTAKKEEDIKKWRKGLENKRKNEIEEQRRLQN